MRLQAMNTRLRAIATINEAKGCLTTRIARLKAKKTGPALNDVTSNLLLFRLV